MSKATHKVTGATISAEESVLRRLGPGWVIQSDKPKSTPRRKSTKK